MSMDAAVYQTAIYKTCTLIKRYAISKINVCTRRIKSMEVLK